MVHRHPGLGISQAEIPYSFLPNRLPFPLVYAKIPIHSIAKTLPSEMLPSAFFPTAIIRTLPLGGARSMKCTYVSTQPFGYTSS